MLTVYFDDPQVAAATAVVELCMEHEDAPPVMIGAPRDLHARAAPTDLVRQHVDGLVAA